MDLEIKRPDHIVPSYSLTGDLLSYLRCRLQYRYYNGSALPPSRPVQLWFGEFLHGTLELVFRFWQDNQNRFDFPWPCTPRPWGEEAPAWAENDIGYFADRVESMLSQQGKQARSTAARESGYHRVELAINQLGPHLFPLVVSAEKKVIGTRAVPPSDLPLRCSNYEVHGVIDVLSNITLGQADNANLIRRAVQELCPDLAGDYEVVVDYKGMQRPRMNEPYWNQGDWQVQTYAWLRSRQPDSSPVAAGILIYINELSPDNREMTNLRRGMADGSADVVPAPGSRDEQLVRMWRHGQDAEQLSLDFRLRRTIRVVPVTQESTEIAKEAFDDVVRQAEEDIVRESLTGNILRAWSPGCNDDATCDACDFRHFCPKPAGKGDDYTPLAPSAP